MTVERLAQLRMRDTLNDPAAVACEVESCSPSRLGAGKEYRAGERVCTCADYSHGAAGGRATVTRVTCA